MSSWVQNLLSMYSQSASRDRNVKVVLLEAGPDGTGYADINTSAFAPLLAVPPGTEYVCNFTCQPDPNLGGLRPPLAQGHALGGGSAVNYLDYCRGAPDVFDQWAADTGISGLRWENFLSERIETSQPNVYGNGPLEITAESDNFGFNQQSVQATTKVLNVSVRDLNSGYGTGATTGPVSIRAKSHTRAYALGAYGWQLATRPNIQVRSKTLAEKINFIGTRAVGVTLKGGKTINAKEVIVSAGAINSPKLLMMPGIGPQDHLQEMGIQVVVDHPDVGPHLVDHHFSVLEYQVTPEIQSVWQWSMSSTGAAQYFREYQENRTGPLAMTNAVGFALARIPNEVFHDTPNASFYTTMGPDRGQLLYEAATAAFILPSPNVSIISPFVALVQPQAEGYLRLNSTNYADDSLIYANYYGSPADQAAIIYGCKKLREIMTSETLAYAIVDEVFPGKNVTSDEDLWHAIQTSAQTFHHPASSVGLGRVLDQDGRVLGVQGLRVVDSSTFPSLPSCHLQATVYAYANLAAKSIEETDRGCRRGTHSDTYEV